MDRACLFLFWNTYNAYDVECSQRVILGFFFSFVNFLTIDLLGLQFITRFLHGTVVYLLHFRLIYLGLSWDFLFLFEDVFAVLYFSVYRDMELFSSSSSVCNSLCVEELRLFFLEK